MSSDRHDPEHVETVVIGGGQAGLSVGYHLRRRNKQFVILEARSRVGDVWRERWDSLRLFTPAVFSGLDGMRFPAPSYSFPTKDEMADYLEAYATRFGLPVRTSTRVERLTRSDGHYVVETGTQRLVADNVVVAMADYQRPKIPSFSHELDPSIVQIHSYDYRNPGQLRDGPVLIIGAGNSGAEIARELAPHHEVWLSGRDTGHIPFRIDGVPSKLILARLVLKGVFHHVLTVETPIGRKARPKMLHKGGPLIRVKSRDLERAGVRRVPKTTGVSAGAPVLDDGRRVEVANIVWCTGFHSGFEWIELPIFSNGDPVHRSGAVPEYTGLYFVGLFFLHALSSAMIHGVGRDAERVARMIARARPRGNGEAAVRSFAGAAGVSA
ncbi:MAG TPA: NAD(P)/FAD-dependent oxidoreductase [Gemmatimonadaceae bacterium]|nr:NAD(P)/FAD-dependent oxidoreductase [Gemmatimonadaceae bacterium]